MNVRDELQAKLARFEELEQLMSQPETMADSSKMAAAAREHGSLARLANKFRAYKKMSDDLHGLIEMSESDDPEERAMAEEELEGLKANRESLWDELLEMTIGGEDAVRSRCVMEIRAGTGGEEAALFARDLYEMYKRNAENKGWKTEIMDMSPTERGGFKEIILGLEGE
ncbi:MAG: PCRF domain-containing protein, partial [Planctomycetales bacterium]|nr:PCRF domain-containing protein [Planctomycetales bacterium]